MFNIMNYLRNENQSYKELPPPNSQNGHRQDVDK